MIVLGIESSCDETAVAIVDDTGKLHADLLLSQFDIHREHEGVVPEIAARAHLDHLDRLLQAAIDESGYDFANLDGIAATCGPGLIGGVMVGMMAGKAIAAAHNRPFIAVNHLEAHALTARLTENIDFPYFLLLVSGGHSQFLAVHGVGDYRLLGSTQDDALGEAFDKSAKLLGLPYPGGPQLESLADECPKDKTDDAHARFPLPRPMSGRPGCDMSFSGLKTAVRTHALTLPDDGNGRIPRAEAAMLARSFEDTVCAVMEERTRRAIKLFRENTSHPPTPAPTPALVVAGGVAANRGLRATLKNLAEESGMTFAAPPIKLCGDNGAMVAWAGLERLRLGLTDPLDTAARPRWPLEDI